MGLQVSGIVFSGLESFQTVGAIVAGNEMANFEVFLETFLPLTECSTI